MGLKGGRNINVLGFRFKWKLAHMRTRIDGDSTQTGDIIIHAVDAPGKIRAKVVSTVPVDEYTLEHGGHKAALTPAGVRKVIEKAVEDGFTVADRRQFELEGPLDLGDYAVPAP